MNGSTPIWVPLAVAALGVGSTLAASIFGQVWARRREEDRWRVEREAERVRWERERAARQEQWQREDAGRWLGDRRQIYADYLHALDRWRSDLVRPDYAAAFGGRIAPDSRAELTSLGDSANQQRELLSLIAPKKVVRLANEAYVSHFRAYTRLVSPWIVQPGDDQEVAVDHSDDDIRAAVRKHDERAAALRRSINELRAAIREDLGIDGPLSVRQRSSVTATATER